MKRLEGRVALVNNAGMGDLAAMEETSLAAYERTIAVDQTGVLLGMYVDGGFAAR